MRPGQNKRMRGRNNGGGNNRKGPNPLTRSYESNGPDVKIRGTAHHIGEKYLQLARDAQSSGDPVMAESYLQHAEHYFRLIASAQQAQQQAAYGYQRPAGEPAEDDDGDDDYSLPDRFASPAERVAQPAPPYEGRQPDRQGYNNGGDRQPYEQRGGERPYERQPHNGYADRQNDRHHQGDRHQGDRQPSDAGERPDRQHDRAQQDRSYNDRQQPYERNGRDRSYGDRPAYGRDQNRDAPRDSAERQPQHQAHVPDRAMPAERPFQAERAAPDRSQQDRSQHERAPRDFDNRPRGRGPRAFRDNGEGRQPEARHSEARQPAADEPVNGLPAFITAPTRVQPDAGEPAAHDTTVRDDLPRTDGTRNGTSGDVTSGEATLSEATAHEGDAGFHLRPRRRRRSKAEFAAGTADAPPSSDPAGD